MKRASGSTIRKTIPAIFFIFALILPVCSGAKEGAGEKAPVSITHQGNYFKVVMDYTSGLSRRQMGEALGAAILKAVPNYETLVDSYIANNVTNYEYHEVFFRVADLKIHLNQDYKDEIEGIASRFSGGTKNVWGDHKISRDEFYLFNLFPDVVRGSECNFIAVFGKRSATGHTMLTRTLDWYGGDFNQLPQIQMVLLYKYADIQVCSIGYLGFQGIISGFNGQRIFAAILDSATGAPFSTRGKRSYPLDLRFALERRTTLNQVADYMMAPQNSYSVNHIIALADPQEGKVLENNFSGQGTTQAQTRRALRGPDSRLNKDITWGIPDAVGSVNSFLLYGNCDNHTPNQVNTRRWRNLKKQLLGKGPVVTLEELKAVAAYHQHGSPGVFMDSGDLYNKMTLQIIAFQPESLALEIFFRPQNTRQAPKVPVYEKITLF